jgi:NitT/TauT family transport system substrate-binding protein
MVRLGLVIAIVAVAVAALLVYMAVNPSSGSKASVKMPVKIGTTVAYYEAIIPLLVADTNGYFQREGLDVSIIGFPGGAEVRKALVAGEVDFGAQSAVHVGIARSAGVDMVVVMSLHELNTIDICVRQGINSLSDLKGKVVGVTVEGSLSWAAAVGYLKKAGLEPGSDVKILSIGSDPAVIVTSLKEGRIDAFACWTNIQLILTKQGIGKPLLNIVTNPQVHEKVMGVQRIMEVVIWTLKNDEKREKALRLKNALKTALDYINRESPETIAQTVLKSRYAKDLLGNVNQEDLVEAIKLLKLGYSRDGSVSKSMWDHSSYVVLLQPAMPDKLKPVAFSDIVWSGVTDVRSD